MSNEQELLPKVFVSHQLALLIERIHMTELFGVTKADTINHLLSQRALEVAKDLREIEAVIEGKEKD